MAEARTKDGETEIGPGRATHGLLGSTPGPLRHIPLPRGRIGRQREYPSEREMGKPNPADVVFWLLAVIAAVVFGVFVLVLGGVVPVESESGSAIETEQIAPAAEPERRATTPTPAARPETSRRSSAGTSTGSAATQPARELVTVVVTASRGDCWLSARVGSETGRVLEERVLLQGESVRVRAGRVWLSLGASSNVDVLVDEEPRPVPAGTVAVVLAPSSTS